MYSFAVSVDFELTGTDVLVCGAICEKNGADQLQTGTYVSLSIVHVGAFRFSSCIWLILHSYPLKTWYFAISFAVLSAGMTVLANWKPRDGQPATYGHIQTLADLVDEWPRETMWWGHKGEIEHGGQRLGHAGEDFIHNTRLIAYRGLYQVHPITSWNLYGSIWSTHDNATK